MKKKDFDPIRVAQKFKQRNETLIQQRIDNEILEKRKKHIDFCMTYLIEHYNSETINDYLLPCQTRLLRLYEIIKIPLYLGVDKVRLRSLLYKYPLLYGFIIKNYKGNVNENIRIKSWPELFNGYLEHILSNFCTTMFIHDKLVELFLNFHFDDDIDDKDLCSGEYVDFIVEKSLEWYWTIDMDKERASFEGYYFYVQMELMKKNGDLIKKDGNYCITDEKYQEYLNVVNKN
jgi:hypothetical protein